MPNSRFMALSSAWEHRPPEINSRQVSLPVIFAENVFTRQVMSNYIPENILSQLFDVIDNNKPLGRDIAGSVALGMKKWAHEHGATHYTHWFQPLNGGTAEKHESFIEIDHKGGVIEQLSGNELYQQEPDASSFPSGGLRNTFEARGYSAWDPTSPAFIIGDTLCIPTIFVAYTGVALDYKTPLIRSIDAIDKAATEVCNLFDKNVKRVHVNLGWEQEYFLVDESLWAMRPDLVMTGRTLMGHASAKNQQLDDHYFGTIPERVLRFMTELETEAHRLGIPVKTRHNEVAPNQFELAPIYEEVNLANDHNQLLMSLMERIARKHHFRVLFHEKPFSGVNGSGKHCNWSIETNTGINLLSPGKNPYSNLQFVTFLVNVLMAVNEHNGLLKASIASAGNAHRLGANEAPPSIISVFLGTQLTAALDEIENATAEQAIVINAKKEMKLGVAHIPEILLDNTDRNRTSPFAFTGNRFEFRAVGSSANCAAAMLALNSAVANQLINFKNEATQLINNGVPKEKALFNIIQRYIKQCKAIRFDGNGYSDEWLKEAAKRGLDCETSVPLMIDRYLSESSLKMFTQTGVLTKEELQSRCEVKWENYSIKLQIESRVLGDMVINHVLPVAERYLTVLLDNILKTEAIFTKDEAATLTQQDRQLVRKIKQHISAIIAEVDQLKEQRSIANHEPDLRQKAILFHDNIFPLMESIRHHVNALELVVDDELWTLPKYRELLFIK